MQTSVLKIMLSMNEWCLVTRLRVTSGAVPAQQPLVQLQSSTRSQYSADPSQVTVVAAMDTDKQELVKVVLVGDSGVGKTRLVCARAYLQSVPLATLVKTHVPTIWAIDQYRIYKDVRITRWNFILKCYSVL